jgi:putative colanic acid biosynthesis acetyltransferase WcaF
MNIKKELQPILDAKSWIDLSKYDQSWFERGKPMWFIFLWWLIEGIAFPLTPHNFYPFRRWLLRLFGAKIGKGVILRSSVRMLYPWKVEIGDYSWIGDDVYFYSLDRIKIGSHCVISQKTYLCTGSHNFYDINFGLVTDSIEIGNGVWIAADCFIAPGIKIGANSIIGARSSVFNNIPHEQVAWGNPCVAHYPRKMPHH